MSHDAVEPVIEQLTHWCETRRQEVVKHVLSQLRGKLSDADCAATENAFGRFQNQFLHGPIRALTEETHAGAACGYTLVEALLKLFRLPDLRSSQHIPFTPTMEASSLPTRRQRLPASTGASPTSPHRRGRDDRGRGKRLDDYQRPADEAAFLESEPRKA